MYFLLLELIFIFSRSLSRLEPFTRAYRSRLRAELWDECRPNRTPSDRPRCYHPFNVHRYCSTFRIRIWRGFGRLIRLSVLDRQQFWIWKWYECIYEYFSSTKSALLFFRGCSIIRKLASGCPDGTGPKFVRTELEISSSMIQSDTLTVTLLICWVKSKFISQNFEKNFLLNDRRSLKTGLFIHLVYEIWPFLKQKME